MLIAVLAGLSLMAWCEVAAAQTASKRSAAELMDAVMWDREPLGGAFALMPIYARDILPEKIESLARGEVPMYEPGLSELILTNAERLHFTTPMEEVKSNAQLLVCCVDTPPTYSGDADLPPAESVAGEAH